MWTDWFLPPEAASLLWVILGTMAMYLVLMGFARWSGVRSFAEMSTFDIAITIANGSVIASTIVSKEPALLQGIVAVATLFSIQLLVSRLRSRLRGVQAMTDNRPIILMGNGGVMKRTNMRVARVTEDDLRSQLRQANVADLSEVQAVIMEGTGDIQVVHGHDSGDIEGSWILEGVRDYEKGDPGRA